MASRIRSARRALPKEVWPIIRAALDDDWELLHGSGKHGYRLAKGGLSIVLSGSPTNPGAMRNMLRQQLAKRERELATTSSGTN